MSTVREGDSGSLVLTAAECPAVLQDYLHLIIIVLFLFFAPPLFPLHTLTPPLHYLSLNATFLLLSFLTSYSFSQFFFFSVSSVFFLASHFSLSLSLSLLFVIPPTTPLLFYPPFHFPLFLVISLSPLCFPLRLSPPCFVPSLLRISFSSSFLRLEDRFPLPSEQLSASLHSPPLGIPGGEGNLI